MKNKKIRFYIPEITLFFFIIISAQATAGSLIISENTEKLASLPDKSKLLAYNTDYPGLNNICMAFIKDKKMYAQINDKVFGPYPHLGKNTPFFAPFTGTSAFIVYSDDKDQVVINGKKQKKYDGIANLTFSPDGKKFAYTAQIKDKQFIVSNRGEHEKFAGIKGTHLFSPDSSKLAYIAFSDPKNGYVISDKKKYGPYRNIRELSFSPDSSTLGFISFREKGWHLVINGKESPAYKNMMLLKFSPSNDSICVVQNKKNKLLLLKNFKEETPFETMGQPFFNPEGSIIAYPAKEGKYWQMIINGKKEFKFDQLGPVSFSKKGNSYGYTGIKNKKPIVVINGKKKNTYDSSGIISFSTDGKHYAYRAFKKDKGWFVVWDGNDGKSYLNVKTPLFNPGKNEIAYQAFTGKTVTMVKNKKEGKKYKSIGSPVFSPKGTRLAYKAQKKDKNWVINIDGEETSSKINVFTTKFDIIFKNEQNLSAIAMKDFNFVKLNCSLRK